MTRQREIPEVTRQKRNIPPTTKPRQNDTNDKADDKNKGNLPICLCLALGLEDRHQPRQVKKTSEEDKFRLQVKTSEDKLRPEVKTS